MQNSPYNSFFFSLSSSSSFSSCRTASILCLSLVHLLASSSLSLSLSLLDSPTALGFPSPPLLHEFQSISPLCVFPELMEIEPFLLLQRYRRDRRRLLEFIISSALARDPSGDPFDFADVDLDTVSVDYVLECAQSGGLFDLSEATQRYFAEQDYPITMNLSSGNSFFLLSEPEISGSPPRRTAPQMGEKITSNHLSFTVEQTEDLTSREIEKPGREIAATFEPCQLVKDANKLMLGLPPLSTGLSDDDMRETAYEVLLASLVISGSLGLIPPIEERKKDKKSRFIAGLRSKKDGTNLHLQLEDDYPDLLDIIRVQMEISEPMDACIKQGLKFFRSNMVHDKADVPQISLELLRTISKSDFPKQKSYTQWMKRQASILEELLVHSANFIVDERAVLSMLLSDLKNVEELVNIGPDGRAEILTCISGFASRLSSNLSKFGVPNESYYWTSSFHFNVKLYEKLLCSIFDVLEDGQILEEAEEILKILKLTWPILGVTQKMHDALYGWLFFQQFVSTGECALLKHAILKTQKLLSSKDDGGTEEAYVNSLMCSIEVCGNIRALKLIDAILLNMFAWCSSQLEDYHMHFDQDKFQMFESVLTMAIFSGSSFADEYGGPMFHLMVGVEVSMVGVEVSHKLVHIFVEKSIQAAYRRTVNNLEAASKKEQKHLLAMLANELKLITEKGFTSFIPVLCQHYPEAGVVTSVRMHQLYGEQLKPFLKGVVDLSESARSVLAASYALELYLLDKLNSICGDGLKSPVISSLQLYQVRDVCAPLILHWVNAQHDKILEWTKRAIQIEDWDPLSSQQRQATSIIEVFRIIEEAVDQFFDLKLPMEIIHLRSLLIGIFRSLDAYLLHMVNQQVDISILYPTPPALTRYKESLYAFVKKKSAEGVVLEERVTDQLYNLTIFKLCVKLNTLHYIREQLDALEDSIQQSWVAVHSVKQAILEKSSATSELVELFTVFDDIRRTAFDASNVIFDFIGARVIFWDMRDSFLSSLYRGSVESIRMEKLIPRLDEVLDDICDLVIDTLRDQVVLSIFQASMDGYVWVLLDGGPSRAFSESDVTIMREDLNILKDFFIADGHGLPLHEVEKESGLAQQILDLYAMKADTIIERLMSASEHISYRPDSKKPGNRSPEDANTLLRILCHKKDDVASEFLRIHYHLPKSSDYEDGMGAESTTISPVLSDILKGNASFNWTEKGQRSFSAMKKKFQEATSNKG